MGDGGEHRSAMSGGRFMGNIPLSFGGSIILI
jgi:hypothetical protein